LAIIAQQLDSVPILAAQAQRILRHYTKADQIRSLFDRYVDWEHLSSDSVIKELAPEWYTSQVSGHGRAPRLAADYWFPPPGSPAGDTVFPVPGKVNLICLGGAPWDGAGNFKEGLRLGYQQAKTLRNWLSLYGDKGLVVTVVRKVMGYPLIVIGGYPLDHRMFFTTAAEAHFWQWYDQVYHQLPVTLAVQVQHTTQWLPSPDGRRLQVADIQFQQYIDSTTKGYDQGARSQLTNDGACTVIDRKGTILYGENGELGDGGVGPLLKWLFSRTVAVSEPASLQHAADSAGMRSKASAQPGRVQ
jgi:hypothetical protein